MPKPKVVCPVCNAADPAPCYDFCVDGEGPSA